MTEAIPTLHARIAAAVATLYDTYPHDHLVYHNLRHTERVVERAQEIATQLGLSEREKSVLYAAAWYHDVGHLTGEAAGHEGRGVAIMREQVGVSPADDPGFLDDVARCIMATKMPHAPTDRLEEVMCDADTYHFGTTEFKDTNKAIRQELRLRGAAHLTEDWPARTVKILEGQRFFTPYCHALLAEGKRANIERWKRKASEARETPAVPEDKAVGAEESKKKKKKSEGAVAEVAAMVEQAVPEAAAKAKKKEEKDKLSPEEKALRDERKRVEGLTARGVQTALRLASENHMKLSDMADGKANILISVNSIIIGVILSVLLRRLEVNPELTIPTLVFLGSSVGTIVIAILATVPKVSQGRFSREDVTSRKTNLLFFGNWHHSSLDDYQWAMGRLMGDHHYLYGSIIKDIYFLGVVLGRKYRLIRLAYYVFMFGILASVIAFTMAVLFKGGPGAPKVVSPTTGPLAP